MRSADRRGFTLLELTAALSVTGLVMLGGIALLDQLGDSATRITRDAARVARDGNGARLLRRLLVDASTSTDSTKRFRGDERSLELWTRCDAPAGWSEPCRVTLAIDERPDSSILMAELPGAPPLAVRRQAGPAEFRYYNPSTGTDTTWVRQWSSNAVRPVAIGLVVREDTVVLPVSVARD